MSPPLDQTQPLEISPRSAPPALRAIAALSRVSPWLGARAARRAFLTPRLHAARPWERESAAKAERVMVGGLHALRWNGQQGRRPVVCLHGWEGRASQFGPFAQRLSSLGFPVISLDGPGHGRNQRRSTHVVQFARALSRVQEELGPLEALIGHSMGGAASGLAVRRGLVTRKLVLLAAPSSIERIMADFVALVGLDGRGRQAFFEAMRETVGHTAEELDLAGGPLALPALALHDPADRDVPFADPQRLLAVWPRLRLEAIEGAGHRRILRDPRTIAAVERFLASAEAEPAAAQR